MFSFRKKSNAQQDGKAKPGENKIVEKQKSDVAAQSGSIREGSSGVPPPRPPRNAAHDAFARFCEENGIDKRTSMRRGTQVEELDAALAKSKPAAIRDSHKNLLTLSLKELVKKLATTEAPEGHDINVRPKELSDVLRTPEFRFAFRNFLRTKFAVENLLAFEMIELYEQLDDSRRITAAEAIMSRFIHDSGACQVNLKSEEKMFLCELEKKKEWHPTSFQEVSRTLYHLMSSNYFHVFCDAVWPGGVLVEDHPFKTLQGKAKRASFNAASLQDMEKAANAHYVDDEVLENAALLEV